MNFVPEHLNAFRRLSLGQELWETVAPSKWVLSANLKPLPEDFALPIAPLNRTMVREHCRRSDVDPLFGYICAMSWGGQSRGRPALVWEDRLRLRQILISLQQGNLNRSQAFELFCQEAAIPGLGPAFFTKLLFFFSPDPQFYIMDQWTSKSINLLAGKAIVKLDAGQTSRRNTGQNYESYCQAVDALAAQTGFSGQEVEMRLFAGGKKGQPQPWRQYVRENWER